MSWYRDIQPGNILCLKDELTIRDLMSDGAKNAIEGLQCQVKSIWTIEHADNLATWILCVLDYDLYFLAKIVDNEHDFRVYFKPSDMEPLTKGDLVNNGVLWLFQPPEEDDFIPADLKYTVEIEHDGAIFSVKGDELHGELWEHPVPSGIPQPLCCSIIEYNTDSDIESPEILILEVGGFDHDGNRVGEGGVVTFLQGSNINHSDVELFA